LTGERWDMVTILEGLAEYVTGLTFGSVPPEVVSKLKAAAAHNFACAFSGRQLPWSKALQEGFADRPADGHVSVWGAGFRTGILEACFINASLSQSTLAEDMHTTSLTHPGSVVFPSVFGLAQTYGATGGEALVAAVIGYDVIGKLGRVMLTRNFRESGWRPTGVFGPLGTAAIASRLLGLSADQTVSALALACNTSGGLRQWAHSGTMDIYSHNGFACRNGVTAALLAQSGLTAPRDMIEGVAGFLNAYGAADQIDALRDEFRGLGQTFEVMEVYFKRYPACGAIQSVAQAALRIGEHDHPDQSLISKVVVGTHRHGKTNPGCDNKGPFLSVGQAQMSNQFVVAASLIYNRLGVQEFMDYGNSEVVRLARKVEVVIDPEYEAAYPDKKRAKVRVEYSDGSVVEEEQDDVRPLEEDEVWQYVRSEAEELLGRSQAEEFVKKLRHLDDSRDVSQIGGML
jgi:2-methylcitrate dehydratase PrpD